MPRNKISDIVEGRILQLLHQGYSQPRIVNILKLDGIHVSQSTVSNVKQKIDPQRNSETKIKIFRKKPSQTPSIIKKVIRKIDVEDPPTQRAIAKDLHISQSTVSNIIKNSGFTLRKKQKVQKITSLNVMKRGQQSFQLYRRLARGFMVWGGVSSQGKTAFRFVAPGTKVNSNYYINKILKPFLAQDVPRLFPKRRKVKWFFHQDSAPKWMPASPDAAPMDYSIWGYLKQQLNKTHIDCLDEL
ncbi:unnamed protein product [Rotaria sp. Silwood2]|nr:unnamed protein product [Rotaria sp. Silwood2]CAF4596083.1 unnamed protein product [Rotaria sp. Silwood2]